MGRKERFQGLARAALVVALATVFPTHKSLAEMVDTMVDKVEEVEGEGSEALVAKKAEIALSEITVRKGDTLSSICAFYGISDWRKVVELNRLENSDLLEIDQVISLPADEDTYHLPYKKIAVFKAGVSISITPWTPEWRETSDATVELVAFTPDLPYSFWGHTFGDGELLQGTFVGLRQLTIGDQVFLSRTWLGEDGDWLKGEVEEIFQTDSFEEKEAILRLANSSQVTLGTCRVETENSEARLIVMVKIKDYQSASPDFFEKMW